MPGAPPRGRLVRDTATDRVGVVMDVFYEGDRPVQIWLRPVGGGQEWTTSPEYLQDVAGDDQVTQW